MTNRKVQIITEEDWQGLEAWIRKHDPDGKLTALQQATAYSEWSEPSEVTIRKQRDEWPH